MRKLNRQYENQDIYKRLSLVSILSVVAFMAAVCLIVVDVALWSMNGEFYMMNIYTIPVVVLVLAASTVLMLVPKISKSPLAQIAQPQTQELETADESEASIVSIDETQVEETQVVDAQVEETQIEETQIEEAQVEGILIDEQIEDTVLQQASIEELSDVTAGATDKILLKKDLSFLRIVTFFALLPIFYVLILYIVNSVLVELEIELLETLADNSIFAMTYFSISYVFSIITVFLLFSASTLMEKDGIDATAPKKSVLFGKISKFFTKIKTNIVEKQKESKQNNIINVYNKSIDVTGKSFFVKNYYKLKKGDVIDLIDLVELDDENSYDVITRIKAGKQIFNKELELLVLDDAASSNDESISQDTKQLAIDIRKKEFDE